MNPRPRKADPIPQADRVQPSRLDAGERAAIVARLSHEDVADLAVAQVFWRDLDDGCYLGSLSSWHRIARFERLSGDRRRQATHPAKKIPVLHATRPNQVWSWDITTLPSVDRGRNFKLYVILDVFSRYVVAWRLEDREDSDLASKMLTQAVAEHGAPQVLHADRGSVMTGTEMTKQLKNLSITQSHSRPKTSNDNPFSEAQFKTAKYDLGYPITFLHIDNAREWTTTFIAYYNGQHRHSGIGNYTPKSVHYGTWTTIRNNRQATLDHAYNAHPERFTRRPTAPTINTNVWINQPPELSQTG